MDENSNDFEAEKSKLVPLVIDHPPCREETQINQLYKTSPRTQRRSAL